MTNQTYRIPGARSEFPISLLMGAGFALLLFVMMALAQMMSAAKPPAREIDETLLAFNAPEIEQIEEEPPPPPEEEEPPPELEEAPPELSLDQLDIALNPGTGGSLVGDFAMPTISTSQRALGTEDFVDFSDLDQIPRPIGVSGFNFPRRLLKKKVRGRLILLVKLSPDGDVTDVELDSSNLPQFDSFVLSEVKRWKFTPPTQQGQPVKAKARLPIPINIE
jgi:protein TonB